MQLNGTGAGKIGLGITLKVMSGDVINIFGKSYYEQQNAGDNSSNNLLPLSILTGFLSLGTGSALFGTHSGIQASELNGIANINSGISDFLANNRTPINSNKPRAYINYIIFDEQFNFVKAGVSPVDIDAFKVKDHHADLQNIAVTKNGYIYVYCSNESPVNVLFDNLQVIHDRGALLEETHYYPFGLTMSGISSKAAGKLENKKKFNGIELNTDFDLNIGEALFRTHDPQLGRWWQPDPKAESFLDLSPYSAMGNNPISITDPLGDSIPTKFYDTKGNQTNTIPDAVQKMYNEEYGITVGYDADKGLLYKSGDFETENTVSPTAKSAWEKQLGDGVSKGSLVFGYGLQLSQKENDLVTSFKDVVGGQTVKNVSYIDMLDFGKNGVMVNSTPNGIPERASNMARATEHEFFGHNIFDKRDMPRGEANGLYNPGGAERIVNVFRREMRLPQQLDYPPQSNGAIRFGTSYSTRTPTTGSLQVRQNSEIQYKVKRIPAGSL